MSTSKRTGWKNGAIPLPNLSVLKHTTKTLWILS